MENIILPYKTDYTAFYIERKSYNKHAILVPFYLSKVGLLSFMSFQFGSGEYHDQSWYEVWANYLGGASKNEYYPRTYRHNNFWYWTSIICFPFSPF